MPLFSYIYLKLLEPIFGWELRIIFRESDWFTMTASLLARRLCWFRNFSIPSSRISYSSGGRYLLRGLLWLRGMFCSVFGYGNTFFVRNPLQHIVPEFAHFVRNMEYQSSFRELYSHSFIHNR